MSRISEAIPWLRVSWVLTLERACGIARPRSPEPAISPRRPSFHRVEGSTIANSSPHSVQDVRGRLPTALAQRYRRRQSSGLVTVAVVERLEVVDVGQYERKRQALARARFTSVSSRNRSKRRFAISVSPSCRDRLSSSRLAAARYRRHFQQLRAGGFDPLKGSNLRVQYDKAHGLDEVVVTPASMARSRS